MQSEVQKRTRKQKEKPAAPSGTAGGIDTHIVTQKGASMNIPEFYDNWRKRTEIQHELERVQAERRVEHELKTDILYFVCAPLVVAAVILAPAICRAIFK